MFFSRLFFSFIFLFSIFLFPCHSQYPSRSVEFVVPFPSGDIEDVLTRMIAEDFEFEHGVLARVINKPSDDGPFYGASYVAESPADGYTIGSFVVGVPVFGPHVGIASLNPDPFEPLGIFLTYPFVIATGSDSPYSTLMELASYSLESPQSLGHFGPYLLPTQTTIAASKLLGFEWLSESTSDNLDCSSLSSGLYDVINTTIQLLIPCLDRVKILASITETPIYLAPDAPTLSSIIPELDISLWNGLFVHKDTPQSVRDVIISSAQNTISSLRVRMLSRRTGAVVYWQDSTSAKERILSDIAVSDMINSIIGE